MMSEDSLTTEPINQRHTQTPTNIKSISVSTKYGYILVTHQGPPNRPVIVTYHDIGSNSTAQFHRFFTDSEMQSVTDHFTIYHINAPGQEDHANPLPNGYIYPTMDQLAETVFDVFDYLNIKSAVGIGVGLGANVLTRYALKYPSKIHGLVLVNGVMRSSRWLEGISLRWPGKDVPEQRWTAQLLNFLMWHQLGPESQSMNSDLAEMLLNHLEENLNPKNVVKLLNTFFKRSAIHLTEPSNKHVVPSRTLQCGVLNLTGVFSPHKKDVIETNERCDSTRSSYVEFADCGGAVLDEQPAKAAEAIRLFLQGLGYMSHLSIPRYSVSNRLAEQKAEYKRQHGAFTKVPRRLSTSISTETHAFNDYDLEDREFEEEFQLEVDT